MWKTILLINSCLWIVAATFCVYAVTYGILALDWNRLLYGVIVLVLFTISQVVISLIAD